MLYFLFLNAEKIKHESNVVKNSIEASSEAWQNQQHKKIWNENAQVIFHLEKILKVFLLLLFLYPGREEKEEMYLMKNNKENYYHTS